MATFPNPKSTNRLKPFKSILPILACLLVFYGGIGTFININALAQSQLLESESLEIITSRGTYVFAIEIADQPEERTIGLMNREKLDPRGGMLFVFDQPNNIQMWMKNTLISLDMIFIDDRGRVIKIAQHTVPHSLDVINSGQNSSFVLELAGGMSAFIGLKPGDNLKHRLFETGASDSD